MYKMGARRLPSVQDIKGPVEAQMYGMGTRRGSGI